MTKTTQTFIKALRQPFRPVPGIGPAACSALTYIIRTNAQKRWNS